MKKLNSILAILISVLFSIVSVAMEDEKDLPIDLPKPSIPVEPISGIINAFQTYSLIALGEGMHGNVQGHKFRLSLVSDPRFVEVVDDIVVEFGNAKYQDVMDRFVGFEEGKDVDDDELRKVWQNTTQASELWDVPIYEEFFRKVRAVNPLKKKLRVLLGDPPIDWDHVHTQEDHKKVPFRDEHAADVIRKEVLNRGRKALLIYGEGHLLRKDLFNDKPVSSDYSIVTQLEDLGTLEDPGQKKVKVFTIFTNTQKVGGEIATLQHDIASWDRPSLSILDGTVLGLTDYAFFSLMTFTTDDGRRLKARPGLKLQDQFDALLYLGPISTITYSEISPQLCSDKSYIAMRKHRAAILGDKSWYRDFKANCLISTAKKWGRNIKGLFK